MEFRHAYCGWDNDDKDMKQKKDEDGNYEKEREKEGRKKITHKKLVTGRKILPGRKCVCTLDGKLLRLLPHLLSFSFLLSLSLFSLSLSSRSLLTDTKQVKRREKNFKLFLSFSLTTVLSVSHLRSKALTCSILFQQSVSSSVFCSSRRESAFEGSKLYLPTIPGPFILLSKEEGEKFSLKQTNSHQCYLAAHSVSR